MTPDPISPVLILENALDAAMCIQVRQAMDRGTPEAAEILDSQIAHDDRVRRTSHIEVDERTLALLEDCLDAHRERIGECFALSLTEREGISLLRYTAGDFFKRHRDWGIVASWPDAARRRISVVIFLTTSLEMDKSGTFSGGVLRLFDEDGSIVRDIHPRAGTLVAFPSTTLHEVTPVVDGVRDTLVDWFY
jgi:predicted 2-oxoglutarate/Fe(II)-dependent dioxygenase YbiX